MLKDLCFEIIETCPNNCLFCSSCSSINKEKLIESLEKTDEDGNLPAFLPVLISIIRSEIKDKS